jgi:hypothetical protein
MHPVKKFLRYAVALFGAYAVAWTFSYIGVFLSRGDGLDLRYFFEYLALAWTFQAGELPAFIWLLSVAVFFLLAPPVIFLLRRHSLGRYTREKARGDATSTI